MLGPSVTHNRAQIDTACFFGVFSCANNCSFVVVRFRAIIPMNRLAANISDTQILPLGFRTGAITRLAQNEIGILGKYSF